jgi:peroxiredoxin
VELQGRYDEIRKQGLGLVAISYNSPETLRKFAVSRGITYALISDPGSAIIKRYGILNERQDPKSSRSVSGGLQLEGRRDVDRPMD